MKKTFKVHHKSDAVIITPAEVDIVAAPESKLDKLEVAIVDQPLAQNTLDADFLIDSSAEENAGQERNRLRELDEALLKVVSILMAPQNRLPAVVLGISAIGLCFPPFPMFHHFFAWLSTPTYLLSGVISALLLKDAPINRVFDLRDIFNLSQPTGRKFAFSCLLMIIPLFFISQGFVAIGMCFTDNPAIGKVILQMFAAVAVGFLATFALNKVWRRPSMQQIAQANYNAFWLSLLMICAAFVGIPWLGIPDGIGHWILSWLHSSVVDAALLPYTSARVSANSYFDCALTLIIYLLVSRPLTPYALDFAIWVAHLKNTRSSSPLRALSESIDHKSLAISVRPARPVLKHVLQSALLFILSYSSIYALITICPGPVPEAVRGWLLSCLAQALEMSRQTSFVYKHQIMQALAALVALWGALPFGLMSLSVLPAARPSLLEIHQWGVYRRSFWSQLPFGNPMRFWQDFKSLTFVPGKISKKQKQKQKRGQEQGRDQEQKDDERYTSSGRLELKFYRGGSWKFYLNQLSKDDLLALLSAVDECADQCLMDPSALALLKGLAATMPQAPQSLQSVRAENRQSAIAKRKFIATVFSPLATGDTIGGYRVIRQLSSKALSAVYLVRTASSRLAILKQFAIPREREGADQQRLGKLVSGFKSECEILQSLDDPSVSKILESFERDGSQYLVLDYAPGKDLLGLVHEHGAFGEQDCRRIAIEIAKIMYRLHQHEPVILHRDLTPDNIVITQTGDLRLVDFGSAHQFVEGITGTLVGKQAYIAPEQLRGKATVQSDIYSFGCCLFYLLTGIEPVALTQSDPTLHGAVVSAPLLQLIKSCTAFDAAERPRDFGEILRLLNDNAIATPALEEHL